MERGIGGGHKARPFVRVARVWPKNSLSGRGQGEGDRLDEAQPPDVLLGPLRAAEDIGKGSARQRIVGSMVMDERRSAILMGIHSARTPGSPIEGKPVSF